MFEMYTYPSNVRHVTRPLAGFATLSRGGARKFIVGSVIYA